MMIHWVTVDPTFSVRMCKGFKVARIDECLCLALVSLLYKCNELKTMELELQRAALSTETVTVRLGPTANTRVYSYLQVLNVNHL